VTSDGRAEVVGMNLGLDGATESSSEVLFARYHSLELLVGVKSFISCTKGKTQNTSVYQASLICQC
jgi:hypothetical protein